MNLNPTEAQKKSGNYAKDKTTWGSLKITIENPAGSIRRGTDKDGTEWESKMHHSYGYINGSIGSDGDQVDVFINKKTYRQRHQNFDVYVINQIDPKTGEFDEHKCMLGFIDQDEAKKGYLSCYEDGWGGIGSIKTMSYDEFVEWVYDKRKTKKLLEHANMFYNYLR